MTQLEIFLKDLEQEAVTTRKMLSIVPEDKFGWKPHEKSMTIQRLVTHIAELPGWISMTLDTNELDFANNTYKVQQVKNHKELMSFFESAYKDGKEHLLKAKEEQLAENWTLRNGDQVYSVSTKAEVIRMALNQIVHHRAQLGVFLRLLDIPIPGSYGPSADETF